MARKHIEQLKLLANFKEANCALCTAMTANSMLCWLLNSQFEGQTQ